MGGISDKAILSVSDLSVETGGHAPVRIVDKFSFQLNSGERLGIVGESGSGKSVSMRALLGLIHPRLHVVDGCAMFQDRDLFKLTGRQLNDIRGLGISMVFQDPLASLNPLQRVDVQIAEAIHSHQSLPKPAVRQRVLELLSAVGFPNPAEQSGSYPHEFSGGMRQRVMIAIALANEPSVLIADEPTTALDVTIQAQVMDLLREIGSRRGLSLILISHDIGLIAENCDRIVVMYSGRVVETGDVRDVLRTARHPYTRALLGSLPSIAGPRQVLSAIPGQPALPAHRPPGCAFHPRCALSKGRAICSAKVPLLTRLENGREAACHFLDETQARQNDGRISTGGSAT